MQCIPDLTTARAELQHMQQVRAVLSDALVGHATQLRSAGLLPPDGLVAELVDYRSRLASLSANVIPTENGGAYAPDGPAQLSLDDVESAMNSQEIWIRCRVTLECMARLSHADETEFAALRQCQAQAAKLLTRMGSTWTSDCDTVSLATEARPFEALTTLLDTTCELPDEAWTAYHELVTATWGRSMSTAVARGKMWFMPDSASESPADATSPQDIPDSNLEPERSQSTPELEQADSPEIALESEPDVSAANGTNADDAAIVFDNQQDLIFDTTSRPGSERSPSHSYRALDLKLLSDEPYQWARPQGTPRADRTAVTAAVSSVRSLARRALEADPTHRGSHLSQLILQLLWDDRPALAYHLAHSLEESATEAPQVPPTWLIHALTLCRHVCYSQGEIARQLERDLEQFQPELIDTSSPDGNIANGFFVRAAALLPALLTASPAAARIIKTFRISPGLSRLYNYCGRILTYGQQFQGRATDLFTPDCDLVEWTEELQRLQQSIEEWLPEVINQHCAVSESTQLYLHAHWTLSSSTATRHDHAARCWSKWQEVLRIVYRLLEPVLAAEPSERNSVKSEVERLTHNVRLEPPPNQPVGLLPTGVMFFPDESMLAVLREAIDFANRWLRLCASKPGEGRTLASRDAQILRDEILERTDDVVAELAAHSEVHDSLCVKAGIACLCRTIEHLRMIFSPHSTLSLRESDCRDLLSNELLNIPHLELDPYGMPKMASNKLMITLLTQLRDMSPGAVKTSEVRFVERSHESTMRILESNLRQSEQQHVSGNQQPTVEMSNCCFE